MKFRARPSLIAGTLLFFTLALTAKLYSLTYLDLKNLTLQERLPSHTQTPAPVTLPWIDFSPTPASTAHPVITQFRGTFKLYPWTQTLLHITADDCIESIEINQRVVPMNQIDHPDACNRDAGFKFDIGRYLIPGNNEISIQLVNTGGKASLSIEPAVKGLLPALWIGLLMTSLTCLVILMTKNFRISPILMILVGLGVGVQMIYMIKTPSSQRVLDFGGHLEHIALVQSDWKMQKSNTCWECHQPPLYYALGALQSKALDLIKVASSEKYLQLMSFALFLFFQIVGCLILQNTLGLSKSWLALGGLVFLFWPSGWIHSARIGNDVPFYLCHTLSFYFLLKSRAKLGESADPQLLWATAWAVLGCFFKISGVFSLLIIGLLILPRLLPRRNSSSQQPRPWPAVGVICVTLALLTWMTLVLKEGTLFKSNQLGASLLVQTNFETILGFDFHSYFHAPFLNSTLDSTGRQTFLNYFLKSSLFGEFNFKAPLQLAIAPILSTLLLVVLALAGVGALCTKKYRLNHHGLHALHLLAGVVTTLSYRAFAPYACNADFRYLYPMVISLTCFAVHGVQVLAQNKNKTAAGIGTLTLVMFATLSAVFYVSL